jgi:PAS domain S-box-containing protein
LQKWGYQPVVAETAELAWDILQSDNPPKLAIVDWKLPQMNGIELCKLIKSQEDGVCYIVMLTGRMSSDDVVIGLESGADDYLVKPVDASELKARLMSGRRILDKIEQLKTSKHRPQKSKQTANINNPAENNFFAPKILIAEDDPVSREVLLENLTRWGFSVIVAENGQQALEAFREHKGPLLGIIDWMMPKLSGLEVCEKIKETAEEGLCYLILLTAKNQREDIVQGLDSGADDYLSKPFHSAELRARINAGIRIINANRHLKAIVSNNSEGIVTIGFDGLIESFNPAAEKMFGYKAHEILGSNILSLIFTEEEKQRLKKLIADSSTAAQQTLELTGITHNAEHFPVELNIAAMNYDGNKHFVCIIRNISERREYERQLIAAKESAESANQAKSRFLSNMSHELRTPLNAILGFAQLLESDTNTLISEEHREYLNYILDGGSHLLTLINEILDLAKIESGKILFDYKVVQVDALLQETIPLVKHLAEKNQVSIHLSSSTAFYAVIADETRFKQVILNLLSNAIKYNSSPGDVFIEISCVEISKLQVKIKDTGIGIPENKQNELFKPFSRISAESNHIEGTGIGLLITKTLIEGMGGAIGFASEVDKGSEFWIQIPLLLVETA